jgi:hypothetical protein
MVDYFYYVLDNKIPFATGLSSFLLAMFIFAAIAVLASTSRVTWAFARDNGLPGSSWIKQGEHPYLTSTRPLILPCELYDASATILNLPIPDPLYPPVSDQHRLLHCIQRYSLPHHRLLLRLIFHPHRASRLQASHAPACTPRFLELGPVGTYHQRPLADMVDHYLGLHILPNRCTCHAGNDELECCVMGWVHGVGIELVWDMAEEGICWANCGRG